MMNSSVITSADFDYLLNFVLTLSSEVRQLIRFILPTGFYYDRSAPVKFATGNLYL